MYWIFQEIGDDVQFYLKLLTFSCFLKDRTCCVHAMAALGIEKEYIMCCDYFYLNLSMSNMRLKLG
jgi:hypothetical protein